MASPSMSNVSWSKGKSDLYYLSSDGRKLSWFIHPPRMALKKATKGLCLSGAILFIPCKNCGRSRLVSCALSSHNSKYIRLNSETVCKLVLMLGVSFNSDTSSSSFYFVKWNNYKYGYTSLTESMETLKNPDRFIKAIFDHEVVVTCVKNMHVRFLKQVSKPSLAAWRFSPTIAKQNGISLAHILPVCQEVPENHFSKSVVNR